MKKILPLFLLSFSFFVNAQYRNPYIGLQAQFVPVNDLSRYDSSFGKYIENGRYGTQTYTLSSSIPLWQKKFYKDASVIPSILSFRLSGNMGYQLMTLDWLNNKPNIVRGNLSLSGFYSNGKKDVFQFVSNAYIGNDEYTISTNPAFRHTGMGMWTHKTKYKVSYQLGWAYSYMFGLGIGLPIAGVTINTGKKSTLNINFPYGITYRYLVNDRFSNRLYVRPNGNVANLTNQFGEFQTRADEVVLRQSEYRGGWQGRYRLKQWVVSADVSYSFYRHLFASERSTGKSVNYAASILKPVPVFSIGLVYNFKNLKKKNQLDINELDLNNVEPEDILNAQ